MLQQIKPECLSVRNNLIGVQILLTLHGHMLGLWQYKWFWLLDLIAATIFSLLTNILAYFAGASVMKKNKFYKIETLMPLRLFFTNLKCLHLSIISYNQNPVIWHLKNRKT
jgi:hypothetical protein